MPKSSDRPKQSAKRLASISLKQFALAVEPLEERQLLAINVTQANLSSFKDASGNYVFNDTASITVDPRVVIDAGGGAITMKAPEITIGAGAQIKTSGAISLTADNTKPYLPFSIFNQFTTIVQAFAGVKASVSIGENVSIDGKSLSIDLKSGDKDAIKDLLNQFPSSGLGSFASGISDVALSTGLQFLSDLSSLPLSAAWKQPSSSITVGAHSQISTADDVNITGTATADATTQAIWSLMLDRGSGFGFAAGASYTDAEATVNLSPSVSINAGGAVKIETTVNSTGAMTSRVSLNQGVNRTNPNNWAIAAAVAITNATSRVTVQNDASIVADKNVSIMASVTNKTSSKANTASYRDGRAGVTAGVGVAHGTAEVIVDGSITAGQVVVPAPLLFNPALTVDFPSRSIVFPAAVGFQTGDEVIYSTALGGAIPGLIDGASYWAIVDPANPKRLKLAATEADALAGRAIDFGAGYPTLTGPNGTALPIVSVNAALADTIVFGFDKWADDTPLFTDGQTVTYAPVAGQFLGRNDASGKLIGAIPAGDYQIKVVPNVENETGMRIQLLDPSTGLVIDLNDNPQFVTDSGVVYQVCSFDADTKSISFVFPTDGSFPVPQQVVNLANAQRITYRQGFGCTVPGLVDGHSYYAVVDPSTPGEIKLADTEIQARASNPVIQNAVPNLLTSANQPFISSSTTSFSSSHQTLNKTLNANKSYSLWNNADGGTFTLDVTAPQGSATTSAIAWNASASEVAAVINAISGMVVTVTGNGKENDPWVIAGQYQLPVGTIETGVGLVFDYNPNLADGTPVIFHQTPGKPVGAVVDGTTYYAYPQLNPYFDADFPQYIVGLRSAPDETLPLIEFDTQQRVTAAGTDLTISGVDAVNGFLALALPQPAPISSVDSSGLIGGSATLTPIPAGSLQLYSSASGGTFNLLVPAGGNYSSTVALPFNATPNQIRQAINDIGALGVVVTKVYGAGTAADPWTLVGTGLDTLQLDDTGLTGSGIWSRFTLEGLKAVSNTATSGTFTLTFDIAGTPHTTAPLSLTATPDTIRAAIDAIGGVLAGKVTGLGTAENPWIIGPRVQSIRTGDAIVFHDAWGQSSSGLLDGQTYYAIVAPTAQQGKSGSVAIQLAATQADAIATIPVAMALTNTTDFEAPELGFMNGGQHAFASPLTSSSNGINLSAKVNSGDSIGTKSANGGEPKLRDLLTRGEFALSNKGGWAAVGNNLQGIWGGGGVGDKKNSIMATVIEGMGFGSSNNSWTFSGSAGVLLVDNTARVVVGPKSVLKTPGAVSITTNIKEALKSSVEGTVSKPGASSTALALAVDVVVAENTSHAIVESGAKITGGSGVTVDSKVTYPWAGQMYTARYSDASKLWSTIRNRSVPLLA